MHHPGLPLFWETGRSGNKMLLKEQQKLSDLGPHTHNLPPHPHKPINVYNEVEESRRYFPIWVSWVLRNSWGNRILQMRMWLPCGTRVSFEVHTLIILSLDLTNLESCTLLFSPLVYKFLESFNTLYLYYLILIITSWGRYITLIFIAEVNLYYTDRKGTT